MAKTKKALVGVLTVQCPDGVYRSFGPGQVEGDKGVVDFLEKEVTNEGAWVDVEEDEDDGASEPAQVPDPPARSAGQKAWTDYYVARSGTAAPEGTSRDDIIKMSEDAGYLA